MATQTTPLPIESGRGSCLAPSPVFTASSQSNRPLGCFTAVDELLV